MHSNLSCTISLFSYEQCCIAILNPTEKATISSLVKDAIMELRSIPPPDYFGKLNRQPYLDRVFWTDGLNPKISGPFANQRDMPSSRDFLEIATRITLLD